MAAIAPVSTADLVDLLKKSGVLTAARLKALPEAAELPDDTQQAAEQLVQKGFVTKFQASQLLLGRHKGFRIGPYAVQDLLGRGGMGAVYLAEHMDLHRKVALKVLAPVRGEGQQLATERFLREARAAAALDHPNIVRVFDVGRHGDTPYIVMEFV
ncbi:MAG: protein kinase domain-containing protein, partial [Gemmata sp.]